MISAHSLDRIAPRDELIILEAALAAGVITRREYEMRLAALLRRAGPPVIVKGARHG
jgi:hypothetical protein